MRTVRRSGSRASARRVGAAPRSGTGVDAAPRLAEELIASSPLGLAYLDRDLRYRRVNHVLAALNGLSIEDHLGRTPMELLPEVDPEQYLPGLRALLGGRRNLMSVALTGRTHANGGQYRRWAVTFHPVRGAGGGVHGIGVVAVDVTEQAAAEEARRREEATARLILESAPSGMLLVDADGAIVAVNREAERLFGYDRTELVGRPVETLLPPRFRSAHPGLRRQFQAEPVTRAMGHGRDLHARRKDGLEFPVEVGLAVTPSAPGLVTAVVSDISERKHIEEERARLLAAEREARDRLARLHTITEAGLTQLPVAELVQVLLDRVTSALEADTATVLLFNEDRTHLVVTASLGMNGLPDDERIPIGAGVAGSVARTARPVTIGDLSSVEVHRQAVIDAQLKSLLAAPLVVDGVVIGVLVVGSRTLGRFGEDDLALLEPVADRVALGLDRARSYERERSIAETLQRGLLPERLPELTSASVAVRYFPGAAGMHIGGDWYDVLETPDGDVVLVIGDVMGRGVRAASVMGQLRNALRVYVQLGLPLAEVVARLNATVLAIGEFEMATLVLVRVAPRTGEVRVVSAGHLPPVVRHVDGSARLLDADNGIALGVTPTAEYAEARARLEPGAGLLLYTDGLVERPGVPLASALDELVATVARAPGTPEFACDALVARFLPKGPQGDDVALLWMRLEPQAVPALDLTVPDSAEEMARARSALRAWLPTAGATEAEVDDVVLAVSEALATHPHQAGADPRRLAVALAGDRVEAVVQAPTPGSPPDGTDRGRGFVLLSAVTDAFEVHRQAGATEVRVVRRLTSARDPDSTPGPCQADDRGLVVPPEPLSVPLCRRYVRERLAGASPQLIENAELCVSELVTNAMLHTGTEIEVRVQHCGDVAHLEVRDGSPVPPSRFSHTAGATTGRGLEMIAGVSRAWGVESVGDGGKAVWCEVTDVGRASADSDLDADLDADLDSVPGAWRDDGPGEPHECTDGSAPPEAPTRPAVVLRRYPVHLGTHARDHVESLLRECALLVQAAQQRAADPPSGLDKLAGALQSYLHQLETLERQRLLAGARSESARDLIVPAPVDERSARAWEAALTELHRRAESGELLTPPPPREVASLHGWVLAEMAGQSRGRAPRAWDGPLD